MSEIVENQGFIGSQVIDMNSWVALYPLKCYYDQKVTFLFSLSFENISLHYSPRQVSNQTSYRKSDIFSFDFLSWLAAITKFTKMADTRF